MNNYTKLYYVLISVFSILFPIHCQPVITFIIDVDAFISKKHTIKRDPVVITVSDLALEENKDEKEGEDDDEQESSLHDAIIPDLIEVTAADGLESDILELYFESKKAGGKRDKEVEWIEDIGNGTFQIKFSSEQGTYN